MSKALRHLALWFLAAAALPACVTIGNADKPIASILVPATAAAEDHPLIVVLPGFGSDAGAMRDHQMAEAVHRHWPEADVLLTSATFAYYKRRNIIDRLDADVIEPARKQGYKQIWLAGASIGGIGVLFYEHEHPGAMSGLVLLAPWLGSAATLEQIHDAGGLRLWNPGPVPALVDDGNYEQELWRVAKNWSGNPAAAQRVWLICGTDDRMLPTARLLAPALPPSHYLELPGGHNWETFAEATDRIITKIREHAAD